MKKIISLLLVLSIIIGLYCGLGYEVLADGTQEGDTVTLDEHTIVNGVCTHCNLPGGACGDNLIWLFDEVSGTLTINGTDNMYNYDSYEDNYSPWSSYIDRILTVDLPEGLSNIGDFAFSGCTKLKSIDIPNGVRSIGRAAFSNCKSLTSVVIPSNIYNIGDEAFSDCTSLSSVEIQEGVEIIGMYAFNNCESLTSINFPKSLRGVGSAMLSGCNGLDSITVASGNSVYHSSGNCFIETESKILIAGCKNSVIPTDGSVMSIGDAAFEGLKDLTSLYIPDCITNISNWNFNGCNNLTLSGKPASYAEIYAEQHGIPYKAVGSVVSIELTNEPTKTVYPIGDCLRTSGLIITGTYDDGSTTDITRSCTIGECDMSSAGVKTVTVTYGELSCELEITVDGELVEYPESEHPYKDNMDETWGYAHKTAADGLKITFSEDTETEEYCDLIYIYDSRGVNVGSYSGTQLAGTTIEVVGNAFFIRLETDGGITNNGFKVTNIEAVNPCEHNFVDFVCQNCGRELAHGTFEETVNWCYDDITGRLELTGYGEIYNSPNIPWSQYSQSITEIVISGDITRIFGYAFNGYSNLKSVEILGGVESIESGAFSYCQRLSSVTIPSSVTIIDNDVFRYCSSLKNISVASENTIYHSVNNCLIQTASKTLVVGCITSVIPTDGSVTRIGDCAFEGREELTSINIPNGITSIGNVAFCGCRSLKSIIIPKTVTYIGDDAFNSCDSLKSITVESENPVYHSVDNCLIETASKTLVAGCTNSIIPTDGSVTSIGAAAFAGRYITSITIPEGITSIGEFAFENCNFESLVIPNSAVSIGDYAFQNCYRLNSLTIPDSVTSIGNGAFWNCPNLTLKVKTASYAHVYAQENQIPFVNEGNIISIELASAPDKTVYPIGGRINKKGLVITGTYDDGSTGDITAVCTIGECDMSTAGVKTVTVTYGEFSCEFEITVDAELVLYPESEHPYQNNIDQVWSYVHSTPAYSLLVTFSEDTMLSDSDSIVIFDEINGLVGQYFYDQLAGQTVEIIGDSFTIRLMSDYMGVANGFTIVNIEAGVPCNHECIDYVCTKCGKMLDNSYVTETLSWNFDREVGELNITGSGEMPSFGPDGNPWSWCSADTKRIVILDGVKSIGSYSFASFGNLTSVVIPASVKRIEDNALPSSENLVLTVAEDSYAHTYAVENGIQFVFFDAECTHETTTSKNAEKYYCQRQGYTGDRYCVDCGLTLSKGEILPAAHNYEFFNVIEPTCGNTGYEIHKCIGCNDIIFTTLAATGHSLVFSHKVDATYGSPAKNVFVCEHCGEEVCKEFGFALCDFNKDGMLTDADFDALANSPEDLEKFDFNGNGESDNFDITVIKHLIEGTEFEKIADVNGDGESNLKDLVRAKKILAGYDVEGDIDRDFDGKPAAKDLVFIQEFAICYLFGKR